MSYLSLDWKRVQSLPGVLPKQLEYLLRVYLTGILCFTLFRLILFLQEFNQLQNLPAGEATALVLKAFLVGLRFDTVVSCYLLSLPFLLLLADYIAGGKRRWLHISAFGIVSLFYLGSFFVCAADLPYFSHFYNRITMAVFISTATDKQDLLGGMIFREWRFFWVIFPLLLISWYFIRKHLRMWRELFMQKLSAPGESWTFGIFALLLLAGTWGNLSVKEPIGSGSAYFSDYGFPNQLGLNPFYTFGRSYLESIGHNVQRVDFMDDEEAIRRVQQYLQVPPNQGFSSPIARQVDFEKTPPSPAPNVVIVMMESMSADKLGRYGNPYGLTPFLDSLAAVGWAFDSVFTSGIHTFAGVYSTLFSQPVMRRRHPLVEVDSMAGIAETLRQYNYSTAYFTTHDEYFDNTGAFLRANGFERIVSKDDYPKEKILSPLGVGDDYLFEHAVPVITGIHAKGKPFLAAIMTCSDHGPYIVPSYFKPKNKEAKRGVVEYVDWSVRKFLRLASKEPWFDNTLFVFLADHGASVDTRYDLPLSYVHTPLIFYSPKLLGETKQFGCLGSQLDVFPTIMGILQLPYLNNTLGIDLQREQRPFAVCYADDKYGVLNREYFYINRENGVTSLYHYKTKDLKDHKMKMPGLVEEMKTYAESMFQTAQWLREN
jgi:phosphoglycerol transferase MdoB-like AlkP superfamily enzyme